MNKATLQYIQLVYFYRLLLIRQLALFNLLSLLAENLSEEISPLEENENAGDSPLRPAVCAQKGRWRRKDTAQEEDPETSLMYYGARYYDPGIGRFITADSVVGADGNMGFNRYMYVAGNPVMYNDPSGHILLETILVLMVIGAIAGAIGAYAIDVIGSCLSGTCNFNPNWEHIAIGAGVGAIGGLLTALGFGIPFVGDIFVNAGLNGLVSGSGTSGLFVGLGSGDQQVTDRSGSVLNNPGTQTSEGYKCYYYNDCGQTESTPTWLDQNKDWVIGVSVVVGIIGLAILCNAYCAAIAAYMGPEATTLLVTASSAARVYVGEAPATGMMTKTALNYSGHQLTKHPNLARLLKTRVSGSPEEINILAEKLIKFIRTNGTRSEIRHHARFGNIYDITIKGLGARFSATTGEFIHFLGRGN
jgi:RHS repeat-associated protein